MDLDKANRVGRKYAKFKTKDENGDRHTSSHETKEYKQFAKGTQDPHCTQKLITNGNQNLPGQDEVVYMPLVNTFNNLVKCPSE